MHSSQVFCALILGRGIYELLTRFHVCDRLVFIVNRIILTVVNVVLFVTGVFVCACKEIPSPERRKFLRLIGVSRKQLNTWLDVPENIAYKAIEDHLINGSSRRYHVFQLIHINTVSGTRLFSCKGSQIKPMLPHSPSTKVRFMLSALRKYLHTNLRKSKRSSSHLMLCQFQQ